MCGRVVLGVSGGIAAYKSAEIVRGLQRAGCEVRVVMTRHATEFLNPRTLAVLSGHPVEVSQWDRPTEAGVDHVELARWADLLLVAPATANVLAKMAAGIADDALTTYHLAHRTAVAIAPAMNTFMWRHPAIREAVERLVGRGASVIPPGEGALACGDEGEGRLAEVETIVDAALKLLPGRGPLAGLQVVVTAGPTRESVDAVRVLTNRSSGRQGIALAAAARALGATVTLLHGPISVAPPPGVECFPFETADDLGRLLEKHTVGVDAVFHAAAVADLHPARPVTGKLDRRAGGSTLELEPVPDLAAALGRREQKPFLVVFAAEVGEDRERARGKMAAKGADAVVLNDISAPGSGMETLENAVVVMTAAGDEREIERAPKDVVAREILLTLSAEILQAAGRRADGA